MRVGDVAGNIFLSLADVSCQRRRTPLTTQFWWGGQMEMARSADWSRSLS